MDQRRFQSRSLCLSSLIAAVFLTACGSGSGPSGPNQVKDGTIAGTLSGTTSRGAVSGTASGSISGGGAMSGTLSGTIRAASSASGLRTADVAPDVTFTGSMSGTHGGGGVTGTFNGTVSDGGTFTGTFRGEMVGATLTYRATGSITFSGAVTGDVAVALQGDCPGGPDVPDQPGPTPTPSPTPPPPPAPAPTPAPPPPSPASALIGNWSGTYTLNTVPGSMTWSITTGGADGNSGTYAGSVDPMRSGSLNLGVLGPDNSLSMTLRLTCPNQVSLVVFQGSAQLSGSTIRGTASSVGGGNCGDANLATWTVSLAMTKN